MTTKCSRVLVIGAGVSGITSTKCCLDEDLDVTCVERTDSIGGLWHYTPEAVDGQPCVNKSTVINTSKEMTAFSDYPIGENYANYMHNTKLMEYFTAYAENFGVMRKIRFHTEVMKLSRAEDFDSTGRWDVKLKDLKNGTESTETFDAVLVCTGHHADKNIPHFQGQESFTGKMIHSHDYKDQRGYEDQTIVVVGIGNSGVDIAVELGRVGKQTYLSTRRGAWVFKRVYKNGLPIDITRANRFGQALMSALPVSVVEYLAQADLNGYMDHERYGLKPKHGVMAAHPTVNDDLANRIACGSVKVKADIDRISGSTIYFTDGTVEKDIDVIFTCTGYVFGFPFIEPGIIDVKDNVSDLYRYMFPPQLTRNTLAVIGYIQPLGSIMPISELQARVATRVFKNIHRLPSKRDMVSDIHRRRAMMKKRYVTSQRHTIQVDYVKYMDELAECIGAKPDLWGLMKTDPKLALTCYFGPCTPYQFRLQGPGTWDGAREAIMTQMDRVEKATRTRPLGNTSSSMLSPPMMLLLLIMVIVTLFLTLVL